MQKVLSFIKTRIEILYRNESGLGLAESLIAIAVIGVAVSMFITTLSTGSVVVNEYGQEVVAQSLAQSQIEHTKAALYSVSGSSYAIVESPEGYSLTMDVDSEFYTDADIQKLTVTVYRDGTEVITVEDYKVDR